MQHETNKLITEELRVGDPSTPSLSYGEIGERSVIDVGIAVGAIVPPDEFYEEIEEEPGGTVDVFVLSFTTLDKKSHEFILPPNLCYEISKSIHEWLSALIDAKRIPCPCGGCE